MKRILAGIGAFLFTLALAVPAFAWHVSDVTVECSEQDAVLAVSVSLSDNGPGTYTDSEGNSGSFGAVDSFAYNLSTTPSSLTVNVEWFTEESASFTTEDIDECVVETTTTTAPPPTTTTAPTPTTTVPTSTTSLPSPPASTPAPPTEVLTPSLAETGSETLWLALSGLSALALGSWLIRRNRREVV